MVIASSFIIHLSAETGKQQQQHQQQWNVNGRATLRCRRYHKIDSILVMSSISSIRQIDSSIYCVASLVRTDQIDIYPDPRKNERSRWKLAKNESRN